MSERTEKYDIIAVGAGPANILFLLELIKLNNGLGNLKVLLIEAGTKIEDRVCPAGDGKCIGCPICAKQGGFGGQGASSDGKYSLFYANQNSLEVGGNLEEKLGIDCAKELILAADEYYLKYGATTHIEGTEFIKEKEAIIKKAAENSLKVLDYPVRHIGTDCCQKILKKIQDYLLKNGVEIAFKTKVSDFIVNNKTIRGVVTSSRSGSKRLYSDIVIAGVGRNGAQWLSEMCEKHKIDSNPGIIDIGVRYELKNEVMEDVNRIFYELKAVGYFPDKTRSFCQNPSGITTREVYAKNIFGVNGHSNSSDGVRTDNTNEAILVSYHFPNMKNVIKFGMNIAECFSLLGGNNVMVQRLGDVGVRATNKTDLLRNSVVPTLDATPGDISIVLGGRIINNIVAYINAMDKVVPGFANPDNLLYAPEIKFYCNQIFLSNSFETSIKGLYAIGDGCGLTRGLAQSSASGVYLARVLKKLL